MNAKEQALAALNAVPGMVDVYTALIALGNRFDDISKYMMSPAMNTVAQLMKQHILDGTGLKLTMSQAIKVLKGESIKKAKTFFYWYKDKYKDITTENFEDLTEQDFDKLINGIRKIHTADSNDIYSEDIYAEYFDPVDLFDFDDGPDYGPKIDFANEDDVPYQELKALEALLNVYKEAYVQRTMMSKADLNNLETIRTICDTTVETQQVLGGGAGINQGVKTQNYDKYAWRKRLETYYDKLFKNAGYSSVGTVDLEELIKNEDLRNKALHIAKDINKDSYDPITVLMTVPHYKAMLEAWATGEELTRTVSFRQRCVRILEKALKPKNRTDYSKIMGVLNDSIVANWLISANLQIGKKSYDFGETGRVSTISFGDVESLSDIAELKKRMEGDWLSELKKEMPGNAFLASIRKAVKEGPDGLVMYLKPDIPMNEIDDSEAYKRRYRAMCEDFRSLVNTTCPYIKMGDKDISWGDAFFLYNLIVNKEQAGPDSMTRLFETMILDPRFMKGEFVASSYYDYLQDLDRNGKAETFITNSTIRDCEDAIKLGNNSDNRKNVHWTFALSNTMGGYKTLRSTTMIGSKDGTNMTLRDTLKYLTAETAPEAYEHFHFYSDEVLDALSKREAVENDVAQVFTTEGIIDVDKVRQYKDAKAFIYNGEIYINKSKADITDALHELMHITLATMKWSKDEEIKANYYNILNEVQAYINDPKATPEVKQLKNKYAKKGFAGSDLLEEVFVSLCSMYAQNTYMVGDKVIENLDTILKVEEGVNPLEKLFKEVFANPRVKGDDSLSALVSKVSDLPLSTNIVESVAYQKLSSKVAVLKEKLVNNYKKTGSSLAYICQ